MSELILIMTIAVSVFAYALIGFTTYYSVYKYVTNDCNKCQRDGTAYCWKDHKGTAGFSGAVWPLAGVAVVLLGILTALFFTIEFVFTIPRNMGKRLSDWIVK